MTFLKKHSETVSWTRFSGSRESSKTIFKFDKTFTLIKSPKVDLIFVHPNNWNQVIILWIPDDKGTFKMLVSSTTS